MSDELSSNIETLTEYVLRLEKRVSQLEDNNSLLKRQLSDQQTNMSVVRNELPNTSLLSPSFLKRAFTVWGHYVVAQLIIVVPIYIFIALINL